LPARPRVGSPAASRLARSASISTASSKSSSKAPLRSLPPSPYPPGGVIPAPSSVSAGGAAAAACCLLLPWEAVEPLPLPPRSLSKKCGGSTMLSTSPMSAVLRALSVGLRVRERGRGKRARVSQPPSEEGGKKRRREDEWVVHRRRRDGREGGCEGETARVRCRRERR
jgi:hypothetical protein